MKNRFRIYHSPLAHRNSGNPDWLVRFALAGLAVLAVLKLGSEFYRLALDSGPIGAIDLVQRYVEIQQWFNGGPVYGFISHATYPPASLLILWPVTGWESLQFTRWLWLLIAIASLAWLVLLLLRECDARTWPERFFVALIPLSMNATGVAIGNGQPAFFLLPLLLTMLVIMRSGKPGWKTDLTIATLLVLALVKPSFSAPFFLIVLLVRPGIRAATVCVAGYLLVTYLSTLFQQQDMSTLLGDWFYETLEINARAAVDLDYGSIHSWLSHTNLGEWNSLASLLLISVLALWLHRVRRVDLWLIFGVTAVVARTWTYHGIYDDMLIIIPVIAVFRHAKAVAGDGSMEWSSLFLLSGSVFVMLLPARLFYVWESPWPTLYAGSHVFFWILLLIYLVVAAEKANQER